MFTALRWVWRRVRSVFGLILPMTAALTGRTGRSVLFWVAHVVVVAGILVGLWWLNRYFDLPRLLRAPTEWLAEFWLPLLFLLLYVNLWLGWYLWKLLRPEARVSPFPDIDRAWELTGKALERAGIDPHWVPLYLVLGRPRAGEEYLFEAARVRANPMGVFGEPPLKVFAAPGAIYLTCADCSLSGALARWAEQIPGEGEDLEPPPAAAEAAALPAPAAFPSLAAAEEDEGEPAVAPGGPGGEAPGGEPPRPLTRNLPELERQEARFRYLCELVRRLRRPFCPVNGVLVLLPEACTRTEALANQAAYLAARDLRALTEVLQVRCPVQAVVCDGEQIPGFTTFVGLIPRDRRGQRLGRRLPYAPAIGNKERAGMIEQAVRWQYAELIPRLVYRVFPVTPPAGGGPAERLLEFVDRAHARHLVVAGLFGRLFGEEQEGAVWVGGCYLAGTGRAREEQAFLADVFAQMAEGQNLVAWTEPALAEERQYARWTAAGYGGIFLLCAGVAALAVALL